MATLPPVPGRAPAVVAAGAVPEPDDLAVAEQTTETTEPQSPGERFVDLHSWWRTTSDDKTPFCVVEKVTQWMAKGPRTSAIWILFVGDSNQVLRPIEKFWKAVDDGKIESITHR